MVLNYIIKKPHYQSFSCIFLLNNIKLGLKKKKKIYGVKLHYQKATLPKFL